MMNSDSKNTNTNTGDSDSGYSMLSMNANGNIQSRVIEPFKQGIEYADSSTQSTVQQIPIKYPILINTTEILDSYCKDEKGDLKAQPGSEMYTILQNTDNYNSICLFTNPPAYIMKDMDLRSNLNNNSVDTILECFDANGRKCEIVDLYTDIPSFVRNANNVLSDWYDAGILYVNYILDEMTKIIEKNLISENIFNELWVASKEGYSGYTFDQWWNSFNIFQKKYIVKRVIQQRIFDNISGAHFMTYVLSSIYMDSNGTLHLAISEMEIKGDPDIDVDKTEAKYRTNGIQLMRMNKLQPYALIINDLIDHLTTSSDIYRSMNLQECKFTIDDNYIGYPLVFDYYPSLYLCSLVSLQHVLLKHPKPKFNTNNIDESFFAKLKNTSSSTILTRFMDNLKLLEPIYKASEAAK